VGYPFLIDLQIRAVIDLQIRAVIDCLFALWKMSYHFISGCNSILMSTACEFRSGVLTISFLS